MNASPLRRLPWLTFLGAVAALLAAFIPEAMREALQFDRGALLRGELWRTFTGHFLHWTPSHLLWNVAAFTAFGSLLEISSRRLLVVVLSVGLKVIPVALLTFTPELEFYRGLSGLASALFVAAALEWFARARVEKSRLGSALALTALVGFAVKLAVEFVAGGTVFVATDASFHSVPLAHLTGALVAGVAFALRQLAGSRTHATAHSSSTPCTP